MNDLIPLMDVPTILPKRNGKKVHIRTVRRWVTKGLKDRKLKSVRVGGRYYVRLEWLEQFIATTATHDPISAASLARPLSARRIREREEARRRAREIFGLPVDDGAEP